MASDVGGLLRGLLAYPFVSLSLQLRRLGFWIMGLDRVAGFGIFKHPEYGYGLKHEGGPLQWRDSPGETVAALKWQLDRWLEIETERWNNEAPAGTKNIHD